MRRVRHADRLGETMKHLTSRILISTIVFCSSLSLVDSYKIYAKTKIGSSKQFNCLDKLWIKESNWNPKAKLGSHYGIPQGRSIYLKTADPYEQIDWGLKYLKNRYSKDFACEALAHMNAKGYS
jgi:hypothetical protein